MKNSFKHALRGFVISLGRERNMRIHLAFAFYVLIACAVTGASRWEWAACTICIAAVTSAEVFNTALEKLCDFLHPKRSDAIRAVKDCSAGAVLVMAAGSAVAGGIVFFNRVKVEAALRFARENIPLTAIIILTLPAAVYLIIRGYGHDRKDSNDNTGGPA